MSSKRLWKPVKGPDKFGGPNLLLDRSNRSDWCSIPVWPVWQISVHSWNLVSLHHSWNLSRFWALWFCQDHHIASLFIVRWHILKREIKHIRIKLGMSTWFFFVPFYICLSFRVSTWSWLEQLCLEPVTMDLHIIWSRLHFLSMSPILYDSIEIDT
jgi:hypothetical protein